ncbi:MAG TPA: DNA topoisomerase (ATP-hydrolyzing) subunit B [Candidatus Nanoarchaeia archaeon]|nr:DNA topoisomerase (ATP-hydrolyzing) subunit B [Candidatus Nanoarchaeia archaeon]
MAEKKDYSAKSIKVLEGLEGVRRRPAMYIGSTGRDGLQHLIYEAVDNSVDEALAGFAKEIKISLNKDGSATIQDDGRGIPVDNHSYYKVPAVQVALTKLHAGGKFDRKSYAISGGLHGVGISCVNALSSKLVVEVKKNGKVYRQEYSKGKPKTKLQVVGKTKPEETGTKITFFPDEEIFSTTDFSYSSLETRFREIAFLNAGLKITLRDEREDKQQDFHYSGGIIEFVKWINKSKDTLHQKPIYFKRKTDGLVAEISIQYTNSYKDSIYGFVNTINTIEGGTHVSGFKTALTRVVNDYAKKRNLLKTGNLSGDDVREGLTAIVSIKIPDPQFEGQTKTKLGNSEVKGVIDSMVTSALSEFLEENPPVGKRIASKAVDASKARQAAKKAKDLVRRKNAFSLGGLPGKLSDCSNKKSDETELYIVEGDSAGGCFSGDTKVALADGRNISFKELVKEDNEGKTNYCYTVDNNGGVAMGEIKSPRITKRDVDVIKVVLDNNEEIVCTPDHKFMLRSGKYKQAKNLTKRDSLMPLHKRISKIGGRITIDGYEMVWDPNKTWIFTHLLSDDFNIKNKKYDKNQGEHKHHIDFNKRNNNPSNIIRMKKEDHLILHNEHLEKTLHSREGKEKSLEAHKKPEYRNRISEWAKSPKINKMLSKKAKEQWEDPEYKEYMKNKFLEFINNNKEAREEILERLDKDQKKYWSNPQNRKKASQKIKAFFKGNPEAREHLSKVAKKQWNNKNLLNWRSQKTKEQWTPGFRRKRKQALNKTYYEKTIKIMKEILEKYGTLKDFDEIRVSNNDKSVLSLDTFCNRYFNNDYGNMMEHVRLYNHKIKRIEKLKKKIDVYDLEVPGTHNFALSSGVFVHNSAKQARDKETQAILPLKGKILNVEKAAPARALSSDEISNMITAIGTGVGEDFDITKIRYNRIVIMTDADVDGDHIKTLLLTFFYRFMPKLIEEGYIYAAMPPLYRVRKKKDYYVYSEEELEKMQEKLNISKQQNVTRFKGLGEMSQKQLWETTMNPKTRKVKRIYIEDALEADQIFSMLMGEKVQARREFIQENAKKADLDI